MASQGWNHHTFDHAHESPPIMLTPLIVLSVGAIFAGAMFFQPFVGGAEHEGSVVESHVANMHDEVASESERISTDHKEMNRFVFWGKSIKVLPEHDVLEAAHHIPSWVKYLPTVMGVLGLFLSWVFYSSKPQMPAVFVRTFKGIHTLFFRKWFFDELYNAIFVKNAICAGNVFWKTDKNVVDGLGPDGIAARSMDAAGVMKKFQTGYVFHYAFVMIIGVISLVSWFFYQYAG